MKNNFYLLFLFVLLSYLSFAQTGSLDPTFSGDGKVTTPIGTGIDEGRGMAVQSDGKILVAGFSSNGSNTDFALVRYNTNGTLDATFDGDGIVTTAIGPINDSAYAVAIQSDGKILVAGSSDQFGLSVIQRDFALVRYNTDGSLDVTFDGDGIVITSFGQLADAAFSMILQNDGKIILAGYTTLITGPAFALTRYHSNGTLDLSFDTDGKVFTAIGPSYSKINSVALQSDGKIVVAGQSFDGLSYEFALARYNSNGTLDVTFDGDGIVITDIGTAFSEAFSIVIQNDEKIVAGGYSRSGFNQDFALARYNTNGTLDMSFDGDGIVTTALGPSTDFVQSLSLQNDGKILAGGLSSNGTNFDFALARYNTNGSLDATFDGDGKVLTDFATSADRGYAIELSGMRIYVAGVSNDNFAIAAYLNDAIALPLSLSSFSGENNSNSVQLKWETVAEQNTAIFEIERSTDGRSYEKIGVVNASGNSTSVEAYSYTDNLLNFNRQQPTVFYRLKMVDKDASFNYSKIVAVKLKASTHNLQIFPNPVKDVLYVQATGNETAILQITDATGRVIKQQKVQLNGSTSLTIDVQALPRGKYFLLLKRKIKEVQQFVKQ